jgi:hypothetical protein
MKKVLLGLLFISFFTCASERNFNDFYQAVQENKFDAAKQYIQESVAAGDDLYGPCKYVQDQLFVLCVDKEMGCWVNTNFMDQLGSIMQLFPRQYIHQVLRVHQKEQIKHLNAAVQSNRDVDTIRWHVAKCALVGINAYSLQEGKRKLVEDNNISWQDKGTTIDFVSHIIQIIESHQW